MFFPFKSLLKCILIVISWLSSIFMCWMLKFDQPAGVHVWDEPVLNKQKEHWIGPSFFVISLSLFPDDVPGFIWTKIRAQANRRRWGPLSCFRVVFTLFRFPNLVPNLGRSRHSSWPTRTRCTCCGWFRNTLSSQSVKSSSPSPALSSPTLR